MTKEDKIQKWMDLADKASQLWPQIADAVIELARQHIKEINKQVD